MDIDTFFVRVPCVFFEKYEKHRIFMRCFSPATLLEAQVGGDKRDRTADLLNAIQALSQLSYTPIFAMPQVSPFSASDILPETLRFVNDKNQNFFFFPEKISTESSGAGASSLHKIYQ